MLRRTRLFALAAAAMLPASAAMADPKPDTANIWTLQDENASISAGDITDRLYTNGLKLGWTSGTDQVPDVVARLGRSLWGEGLQRVGISLTQQIYTPTNTDISPADPHDRPYAGVLLANFSLLSDTDDTRSVLGVSLGIVGPGSGAEALQNAFHGVIGQGRNQGWGSQIDNTFAFQVLHERTWRLPIAQFAGLETDALPALTVGIGNLRDYAQVGVSFRLGQGLDSDFGVPRVRPGLSGGDAFTPTRPFAWYVFAGANGQAVAYDLLLTQSVFRGGPHVSPVWDVGEMQAGFAVMAYGMRLTFAYVAQTQEFHGQSGGLHQFGSAALSVRF
ncbi:MAG: lipid A deacylase LpxR family protein [Rhodospirillales bacterium]|nr:lipid A deacylase LpxR family protein [Rhodospirillales bacterium]